MVEHRIALKQRVRDINRDVWRMVCGKRMPVPYLRGLDGFYVTDGAGARLQLEDLPESSLVHVERGEPMVTCPRCLKLQWRAVRQSLETDERIAARLAPTTQRLFRDASERLLNYADGITWRQRDPESI